MFSTVQELVGLWPSVREFADGVGVKPSHAHVFIARGNIPSDYWPAIIDDATRRGIAGVSAESLLAMQQRQKETVAS